MAGRLLAAGCAEAPRARDGRPRGHQHLRDPRGRRAEGHRSAGPARPAQGGQPGAAGRADRVLRPRARPGRAAQALPGGRPLPAARRGAGARRPARAGLGPGADRRRRARRRPRRPASVVGAPTTSPAARAGPSGRGPSPAARRSPPGCRSSTAATRRAPTASCRSAAVPSAAGRSTRSSTRPARWPPPATARSRSSARTSTRTATTWRPRRASRTSTPSAGPAASSTCTAGRTWPSSSARSTACARPTDGRAIPRLRFVTSHPWDLSDRLIAALAECPSVCEHLHLPVQSGSDPVLRRMGRQYTIEHYAERLARIREAVPGITVSTDIIVGFCGETEAQFRETLALLETVRYDQVFAAAYSPRPGTPATHLDDDVPGRRQAPPAQRAARTPGGDRPGPQPGVARPRGRGPRRRGQRRRGRTTTTMSAATRPAPGRA